MESIQIYNKLLPALRTRVNNFKEFGISYISEHDIWVYLNECVWKNLELPINDLISDILNIPSYLIKDYILNKHNKKDNNQVL